MNHTVCRIALCLLCVCGLPRSGHSATPRAFLHYDFEGAAVRHIVDASQNGYHGKFTTPEPRAPRLIDTKYSKALDFGKDVNGGIVVPNARISAAAKGLTVMAWIRPNSIHARQTLLSNLSAREESIRGVDMSINWGKLRAEIGIGTKSAVAVQTASHSIERNVWSHVAMTFDGNELVLFINATPSSRRPLGSKEQLLDSPAEPTIGSRKKNGRFVFKGQLDDVKIFSGALTESQIIVEAAQFLHGHQR